jgi:hypothetical protein
MFLCKPVALARCVWRLHSEFRETIRIDVEQYITNFREISVVIANQEQHTDNLYRNLPKLEFFLVCEIWKYDFIK